ncbi:MAG: helix-turn-helix transcriptional regulator [Rhodobacteraceae bacterium]|nr:helix-turn-helix transcriptional regulator [Paracoccaceae bacterium]
MDSCLRKSFADICDYYRTYIGLIERSERNITVSTLEALAKNFGVEPSDLMRADG